MKVQSFAAAAFGAACLASAGCSKSEASPAAPPTAESKNASPPARGHYESDNFVIEATAPSSARVGEPSAIAVKLSAKGDYHINTQYPYKFKVQEPAPEGVAFPSPTLVRADGRFDEKTGSFNVPFVASRSGKSTVGGTLWVSVCSEANCVMDKQSIEVEVEVATN